MKKLSIIFLVLLFCFAAGCAENIIDSTKQTYSIKYKVSGTAKTANLTYENSDGGTSQESDIALPWTYSFTAKEDAFLYISAQNQGKTGDITTTVYVNDKVFKKSTSNGAFVIATASGAAQQGMILKEDNSIDNDNIDIKQGTDSENGEADNNSSDPENISDNTGTNDGNTSANSDDDNTASNTTISVMNNFRRVGKPEELHPKFNVGTGETTEKKYSGYVEVYVTGSGFDNSYEIDAFYTFSDNGSSDWYPNSLRVGSESKLEDLPYHFDFQPNSSWQEHGAVHAADLIVACESECSYREESGQSNVGYLNMKNGFVPAYNKDHAYHFIIDLGAYTGKLTLGCGDGGLWDNSGQYDITLYQVTSEIPQIPPDNKSTDYYLQFNGGTNNIQVPNNNTLIVDGAMTVEAWTNYAGGGGVGPRIIEIIDTFNLFFYPDNVLNFCLYSTGWTCIDSPFANLNEWAHVAGSWDGNIMYLFVNGSLVNSKKFSGSLSHSGLGDQSLKIGNGWTLIDGINGGIDEVRFSSIARYTSNFTPEQQHTTDSTTIGLWHFNTGEGNTAYDAGTNNNHATIDGAVWVNK